MKILSVINYKGGVGKSTLSANLGAYAASKGYRVLLLDLDPQKNLTYSFMTASEWKEKYSKAGTIKNFFLQVLNDNQELPSLRPLIIRKVIGTATVDILSSHDDLGEIDTRLSNSLAVLDDFSLASKYVNTISCLYRALSELDSEYEIAIIDYPVNFNLMVKSALYASDYYVVPTRLDEKSTGGIAQLEAYIEKFCDEFASYMLRLKTSEFKPLSLRMLGVVPMMVKVAKGTQLIADELEYLNKIEEKYQVFQFVRDNPGIFGTAMRDRNGNVVPPVLAHVKAACAHIKGELKVLCEQIIEAVIK